MNSYRSSSAWTGRAPRTCQEAFGPYTDYRIADVRPAAPAWPWIAWAAVVMSTLLAVALA